MAIEMAGLSPHPPLIIPEVGGRERDKVKKTINSLEELAQEVNKIQPELLITISPHGSVFRDAISVLDLPELKGDFSQFGASSVSFSVKNDQEFITKFKEEVKKEGETLINLDHDNLTRYNLSPELDHGVMVPLYYLQKAGVDIPLVALTMGLMEYNQLYSFGKIIDTVVKKQDKKTVVLASGDLSHRLKPGAPAGFNPRGREFDEKLVDLLRNENFSGILNMEQSLIEKAGECGLRPLIITLGAIQDYQVQTEVKSYEGPFGVGYAVVGFYYNA